jgi:glycolate oxidase FAD binding subunit
VALVAAIDSAGISGLDGLRAIEWGGAQRWYAGEPAAMRERRGPGFGGHAVLYRAPESLRCRDGALSRRCRRPCSPCIGG